jgi:serine/threonine protein phosphatase PrpC
VYSLLEDAERHLAERQGDGPGPFAVAPNDRFQAQVGLQRWDLRCDHDLVVLGRFHRRKGDFLGGAIQGVQGAAFGFASGRSASDVHVDPNEDALGFHRVGDLEIYAVADAHHGAASSEIAVCKLLQLFRLAFDGPGKADPEQVSSFLVNAIARCHATIEADLTAERSRTSLVAAVRQGTNFCWASVSDGFLFRVEAGKFQRANRDRGYGLAGRRSSVWLGDKSFDKDLIDYRCETAVGRSFILATDGFLKHPGYNPRALVEDLSGDRDLDAVAYRMARDYAVSGRDNTSFVILRGPQDP